MKLENTKDCNLMVWETNPKLRNTNNVIKFYVPKSTEVNINDEIFIKGADKNSIYKITEIIDKRSAYISNMNYITAKTDWY